MRRALFPALVCAFLLVSATPAFAQCLSATLSSIDPVSGPTAGGTLVTITGSNFIQGTTTVEFDGMTAANITVLNSTTLTAETPAHAAGYSDLYVYNINCGGQRMIDAFLYLDAVPTLSGYALALFALALGAVAVLVVRR